MTRCCDRPPGHHGDCERICPTCVGLGRCPICDGMGDLDDIRPCRSCAATGYCPAVCDLGIQHAALEGVLQ